MCGWTQFLEKSVSKNPWRSRCLQSYSAVIFTDEYFRKCFVGKKRLCFRERRVYELCLCKGKAMSVQRERGASGVFGDLVLVLKRSGCF